MAIGELNRNIPETYRTFGSYGNNTTIPEAERERTMASNADLGDGRDRAALRGEQALHLFYREMGMAPEGTWTTFLGYTPSSTFPHPSKLPFSEQRRHTTGGRLSKSVRNLEKFQKRQKTH